MPLKPYLAILVAGAFPNRCLSPSVHSSVESMTELFENHLGVSPYFALVEVKCDWMVLASLHMLPKTSLATNCQES